MSLEQAQASKHELICRKLGLPGRGSMRLLDVGCGWGSMAMHAAASCDATVVGITLSQAQADYARQRVAAVGPRRPCGDPRAGLPGPRRRALRRHLVDRHVRARRQGPHRPSTSRPCARCSCRRDGCLNHAISEPGGSKLGRGASSDATSSPMASCSTSETSCSRWSEPGFECRDVESLREHYARTLRAWVANLESQLGCGRRAGRARPCQDLAAVHGRVCDRLRGRRHQRAPGARRRARQGPKRDAADAGRLGLSGLTRGRKPLRSCTPAIRGRRRAPRRRLHACDGRREPRRDQRRKRPPPGPFQVLTGHLFGPFGAATGSLDPVRAGRASFRWTHEC